MLEYPYSIRSDAITAVGAPSSISFIMRAIYWLYMLARIYYGRPEAILEESSEFRDDEEQKSLEDSKAR